MRHSLILPLLLALGGCRSVAPPGTYFDTRPAGAEVLIDGRKSGYVTPCMIALDRGQDHRIEFALPGFQMREVPLKSGSNDTWMPMRDGSGAPNGQRIPLYLQSGELFLPRLTNDSLVPGRIFLRLHPEQR